VFDNLYYKNAEDTLVNAIDSAVAPDLVGLEKEDLDITKIMVSGMADQLKINLSLEAQDYARKLDPLLSAEERNVMIRDFIQSKSGEYAQRASDFNKAFQSRELTKGEISETRRAQIQAARAEVKDKSQTPRTVVYEHLENPNTRYYSKFVENERETMLQRGDKLQLQKSLINKGYLSWDPSSWKLLDETNLSAQDVKLFGNDAELNRVTSDWKDVMIKELSLEELTDEEEKIKDTFQDFGIYDLSTLNTFLAEQGQFFEDRD
jgi:predicted nucleic-acid-binding protein